MPGYFFTLSLASHVSIPESRETAKVDDFIIMFDPKFEVYTFAQITKIQGERLFVTTTFGHKFTVFRNSQCWSLGRELTDYARYGVSVLLQTKDDVLLKPYRCQYFEVDRTKLYGPSCLSKYTVHTTQEEMLKSYDLTLVTESSQRPLEKGNCDVRLLEDSGFETLSICQEVDVFYGSDICSGWRRGLITFLDLERMQIAVPSATGWTQITLPYEKSGHLLAPIGTHTEGPISLHQTVVYEGKMYRVIDLVQKKHLKVATLKGSAGSELQVVPLTDLKPFTTTSEAYVINPTYKFSESLKFGRWGMEFQR